LSPNKFGEFVSNRRKEKKYSLRKMAELLDLSPAYWSDIEKGRRNPPNINKLKELAELLLRYGGHSTVCCRKDSSPHTCICGWGEVKALAAALACGKSSVKKSTRRGVTMRKVIGCVFFSAVCAVGLLDWSDTLLAGVIIALFVVGIYAGTRLFSEPSN